MQWILLKNIADKMKMEKKSIKNRQREKQREHAHTQLNRLSIDVLATAITTLSSMQFCVLFFFRFSLSGGWCIVYYYKSWNKKYTKYAIAILQWEKVMDCFVYICRYIVVDEYVKTLLGLNDISIWLYLLNVRCVLILYFNRMVWLYIFLSVLVDTVYFSYFSSFNTFCCCCCCYSCCYHFISTYFSLYSSHIVFYCYLVEHIASIHLFHFEFI